MLLSDNILNVFMMISQYSVSTVAGYFDHWSLFQVMLLVEAGADAGAIDEEGNNSLHIATRCHSIQ